MFNDLTTEGYVKLTVLYKLVYALSGVFLGLMLIGVASIAIPAGISNSLTWVTDGLEFCNPGLQLTQNSTVAALSGYLNSLPGIALYLVGTVCIRTTRLAITFKHSD